MKGDYGTRYGKPRKYPKLPRKVKKAVQATTVSFSFWVEWPKPGDKPPATFGLLAGLKSAKPVYQRWYWRNGIRRSARV